MTAICQVCGEGVGGDAIFCPECATPHHAECFAWVGRCSTYGCTGVAPRDLIAKVEAMQAASRGKPGPARRVGPAAMVCRGRGGELDLSMLEHLLASEDVEVRRAAASELGERGVAARRMAPALLNALRDDDPQVRFGVTRALYHFPHAVLEDIDAVLTAATKLEEINIHEGKVLCHIGPLATPLVPWLIEQLVKPNKGKRSSYTLEVLASIGPKASAAIDPVRACVADPSSHVRARVCPTLAALGAGSEVLLECAAPLLKDANLYVLSCTSDALGGMGIRASALRGAVLDVVKRLLKKHEAGLEYRDKDDTEYTIGRAVDALGRMGRGAADILPHLMEMRGRLEPLITYKYTGAVKNIEKAVGKA